MNKYNSSITNKARACQNMKFTLKSQMVAPLSEVGYCDKTEENMFQMKTGNLEQVFDLFKSGLACLRLLALHHLEYKYLLSSLYHLFFIKTWKET